MFCFAQFGPRVVTQIASVHTPLRCASSTRFLCSPRTRFRRRPRRITPRHAQMGTPPAAKEEVNPGAVSGSNLQILQYPHPKLRAANETISSTAFDASLRNTAREMLRVMYASRGVGLAAPQVGVNKRLMVFNEEGDSRAFSQEVVMINPRVIATSKRTVVDAEACLSFPNMSGRVRRHEWVKVEAFRLNGRKFKIKFEGWKARIFQHEFDHLQGTLYIDKLEVEEDREAVKEQLDRLVREYNSCAEEGTEAAL